MSRIPESIVLETVTPDVAKRYLDLNTKNARPRNKKLVRRYARVMAADGWYDRHPQGIAFDWDGNLGDGQHRLAAIVASGKPIVMWVHRGCDPATFMAADRGRMRSAADTLRLAGFRKDVDVRRASSVARWMLSPTGAEPVESELEFAKKNETLIGIFLIELKNAWPKRAELIAAFCKATFEYADSDVLECARRYARAEFRGANDPLRLLSVRLFDGMKKGKPPRGSIYAMAVTALRAALEGRELQALRPATQDFKPKRAVSLAVGSRS